MGALVRGFDWSKTALGPIEAWPASLRTTVSTLLHSRQPMFLWWGAELIQFYNDAYRPSLGVGKHPGALGQRGRDCWRESWSIIWPQIHDVMSHARSSWNEDALVPIFRNGRIEEVYWTYGYSPVFDDDGKVGGTLVVGTETTERVIADRRARAIVEGERNNLLLQAPIAIAVLTGPEHRFQLANPVYQRMVGRDDLVGKTYREAFPELADTVLPAILDGVYRHGAPYMTNELRVPLAHGDRYFTFNLEPMRNTAGSVYGMLAVAVDITEQVLARQTLEKTHAERGALLAELQAANRTKDDFLAMLSHELRNPLSPIVTALELMKLRDVDHASGILVVERQVRHLIHLVDDLLDVARITRGHLELVRERVELSVVIARAIELASPLIERGGHVLTVEVPTLGLRVDADLTRLAQVFANLLSNAAKYTPQNGHIWIDAHLVDGQVVVRVRDDGVGIAPEMLCNIFGLFTQVPQDLARSQGGLGLGLSIVKAFTEKHGGTVTARSAGRGHGSEFIVHLPVALAEASASVAPVGSIWPGPEPFHHPSRRILIVDDNEDAAWILAETLSFIGHDVRCAHDGPSALRTALEHVPEVALLDIGLPVMDGYELAARMRAEPRVAGVRLIALTGYSQPGDRQRSTDAGFAAHLVKPVSIDMLVETIDVMR